MNHWAASGLPAAARGPGSAHVTVGANFSPLKNDWGSSTFIGPAFQWVRGFREKALLLPWSEDWAFQTPLVSQQVFSLSVDAMRSGIQWVDEPPPPPPPQSAGGHAYTRTPAPKKHLDMLMCVTGLRIGLAQIYGASQSGAKYRYICDLLYSILIFNGILGLYF
jgi:hypothetical protein